MPDVRAARPDEFALLGAVEAEAGNRFADFGMFLDAPVRVADRAEVPLAVFVSGDPPVGFAWVLLVCGGPHLVPWNGPFYRSAGFVELAPDAWCPEIADLRTTERANGLDEAGARVVMIRHLRAAPRT